jgi:hypothetical protein
MRGKSHRFLGGRSIDPATEPIADLGRIRRAGPNVAEDIRMIHARSVPKLPARRRARLKGSA